MQVHAEYNAKHAFVVTVDEIEKIWSTLSKSYEHIEAQTKCADGINRTFTCSDDLVSYTNPKRAEIKIIEIVFSNRSSEHYDRGSVRIGKKFGETLSLSVHGEENHVTATNTSLRDLFNEIKPWFSGLATLDLSLVFMPLCVLLFSFLYLTTRGNEVKEVSSSSAVLAIVATLGLFATLFLSAWIVGRLRNKIFPIATFAIGQGRVRNELIDKIRWAVVIGSAVSVFASIAVGLMMPK